MLGFKAIHFATIAALFVFGAAEAATPNCSSSDIQCISGVDPGSLQTSGTRAAAAGTGPGRVIPSRISVDVGSYRINNGAFTSAPGTIANGDKVTLQLTAANAYDTDVAQTLSIEGQPNRVFRVITRADTAVVAPPEEPTPETPEPEVVPAPSPDPVTPSQPGATVEAPGIRWSQYGKLTLPVDEDGKPGADEIEAADLDNYSSKYWYQPAPGQLTRSGYNATGNETVFWTPVNGNGITKTASTPRTEMREQKNLGKSRGNWGLSGTHIQTGTVAITAIPTPIKSSTKTFIVFAQIHSVDNAPPIKLFFQRLSNGSTEILSNYNTKPVSGSSVNSPVRVPMHLGDKFNYEIRMVNGIVTTLINGKVLDTQNLNKAWKGAEFFFKAGSYLGNNDQTARGYGEVAYSSIEVTHQ